MLAYLKLQVDFLIAEDSKYALLEFHFLNLHGGEINVDKIFDKVKFY